MSGLSLEGCKWSRNGLDESEPKKMFAPLPILYVTAINKKKGADAEKNSSTYSCPVYKVLYFVIHLSILEELTNISFVELDYLVKVQVLINGN